MSEVTRSDLAAADGAELTQHLLKKGWTAPISTYVAEDGMHVHAKGVAADTITAALDDFVPTAAAGEWRPLPPELIDHAKHIRDYGRLTDADLSLLTTLQVRHTLRDVCRALALLVDRRLD